MSDQQQHSGQPAPMTEARLAEIRARADNQLTRTLDNMTRNGLRKGYTQERMDELLDKARVHGVYPPVLYQDTIALLAFAEAVLPILRAVAEGKARPGFGVCQHCEAYRLMSEHPRTHAWVVTDDYDHTNDCPVTQARALLAGTATTGAADEGSE